MDFLSKFRNTEIYEAGHWFSLMGTVLPFEIITYAI
jgi:hypothetical protein